MKKERYQVTGMSCAACSAAVERGVNKLEGLQSVQVNLLRNVMDVEYDPEKLDSAAIIAAVEKAGYGASLQGAEAAPAAKQSAANDSAEKQKAIRTRLWVSFGFLLPLFYISMGHMMGWPLPHFFHGTENALILAFTQMLLCLPILYVNRKFFINGFGSLFRGNPNMDSLIALGSSAAMVYGIFAIYHIGWGLGHGDLAMVDQYRMDLYFEAAGMILTLITVGKLMEERSKGRTSDALSRLMDLAPPTANVIRGGAEQTIPAEQVVVGDTVVVRPGQSIPVDGIILKGSSWVDESAITGESVPAEKTEGDTVTSATLNTAGYLEIRATRVGSDTTLSQIIHLVEEAGATKAPIARLADQISGIFVPVVLCIALASTVIWLLVGQDLRFAISCGIAVLV
ncbi:MAG: heavy metal translocating P-type ATPase, partial [Oscillospiraceae bacterium]|nr:heavy metal translocating P-type ATPase [Oscillospiraceae bacterium]